MATAIGLLSYGAWWASPTFDEPFHLLRGLNYWWLGDMRAYYAEPPGFNALTTIPAALATPPSDLTGLAGWPALGRATPAFLAANYELARAAITLGRSAVICVYTLMMLLTYSFCLRIWGLRCAWFALIILCFEPLLLAHGQLLTTDLGLSAGVLGAAIATVHYLRTPGLKPWLWLTAAICFCTLTKISGVVIGPLTAVVVMVRAYVHGPRFSAAKRGKRLAQASLQMLAAALATVICINTVFRFDRTGMRVEQILVEKDAKRRLAQDNILHHLPEGLPIPLPYMYVVSLVHVQLEAKAGRKTYFQGTWRNQGTPRYYPTLLLVQGSPTLLGLLLVAFFLLVRRKQLSLPSQVIAAYAIAWLALVMTSRVNIGFRHALPLLPLLSILAARAGDAFFADKYLRPARFLIYILLGFAPITGILTAPRFLGYFNPLGGSPKRAHTINLVGEDWGQDLRDLATYAREQQINMYYHEYRPGLGLRELEYLGVRANQITCKKLPETGLVAIHATVIARGSCFPSLTRDDAVGQFNEHILLFQISPGVDG